MYKMYIMLIFILVVVGAAMCLFLAWIAWEEAHDACAEYTRDYRNILKGVNPVTGRTIFHINEYPFLPNWTNFIDKFYKKGSLIIDKDDVYKITLVRQKNESEKERKEIGSRVLEVDQYAGNSVEKIGMENYNDYIYVLENKDVFIELYMYGKNIGRIEKELRGRKPEIWRKLEELYCGFPISIEDALAIGSTLSAYYGGEGGQEDELISLMKAVYSRLEDRKSNSNTVKMEDRTVFNIKGNVTWNQVGDNFEGDKIVNGISSDDFDKLRTCVNNEGISRDDIAALISVLQEINSSQNDLTTEYAYMASIERNAPKSGFLKKLQEKITLTNGVMTLSKSVGEILSKHPEAVGAVTGFLGTL